MSREKRAFTQRSSTKEVWYRLRHNTSAIVGFVMFIVIVLACFLSTVYLNYETDIIAIDAVNKLQGPSWQHLCGTDELGRDVFYRILWGGKTSITMGLLALGLAFLVGLVLGTVAAYFGKTVDMVIMRLVDVVMALPVLILMITLASVVKPTNVNLVLIIGIALIPQEVRLVRAQVLQLIDKEYIEAVRIQGGSGFRIIVKHIIPNAIGPIITTAMIDIASAITTISTLSFMGLGVQPPDPEWGSMLANGKLVIRDAWNVSTFPGIALLLTVISLTLIGDGLRDALDPRMRR